jgi:hypothetical protein
VSVVDSIDVLEGMTGVALGEVAPRLVELNPLETVIGGWSRFPGRGWVAHGWAEVNADTAGASVTLDTAWDGVRSFILWPAFAWELDEPVAVSP